MNRFSGQYARGGVLVIAAALLVTTIAAAEAQVGTQPPAGLPSETINNPMAVPGFWDPRRRPERPDLSRISIIRFLTETDYPPFNYAGPDGMPAGFSVDLARLICEEIKVACTVQMRRFDTLVDLLKQQQWRRGDRLHRRDAGDAQAGRFQRSLLPHAGALRVAPRLQQR